MYVFTYVHGYFNAIYVHLCFTYCIMYSDDTYSLVYFQKMCICCVSNLNLNSMN